MDADMRNVQKLSRRIALALTLTLGLATIGCAGEMVPLGSGSTGGDDDSAEQPPPPPASNGGGAEATFNTTVKPLLTACAGCHANSGALGFLGAAGADGYYAALTGGDIIDTSAPASSVLLTHAHSPAGPPELDAAGKSAVQAWITEEAAP
jgi:mono/diheme cytochrome c family protein